MPFHTECVRPPWHQGIVILNPTPCRARLSKVGEQTETLQSVTHMGLRYLIISMNSVNCLIFSFRSLISCASIVFFNLFSAILFLSRSLDVVPLHADVRSLPLMADRTDNLTKGRGNLLFSIPPVWVFTQTVRYLITENGIKHTDMLSRNVQFYGGFGR